MRGPKPQHPIVLTPQQQEHLKRIGRAHNSPQTKALRARIILAAFEHPEWSNQQIAADQHCTDRMVREWRKRWVQTQQLDDLPRPGGPRTFSPCDARAGNGAGL